MANQPEARTAGRIFTLEALNARHGDALLLHYGSAKRPKLIIIDGGPMGVYKKTLEPRLKELADARGTTPLPVEHTFVTHLDSDHIAGVLSLANAIADQECPVDCASFWFNTFEDGMKELPPETAEVAGKIPLSSLASVGDVLASVAEGQRLRDAVNEMGAEINGGARFLMADKKGIKLKIDKALKVTLVCPSKEHLRKLAVDWKTKAKPTAAQTAAYLDRSVYNLSSLVLVVEAKGPDGRSRRMLLTGDARGDHIVAGLEKAGFLDSKGRAHFDLFKVSHHGSDRDYELDFFKRISADHYVISADGNYANPSSDVLRWIGQTAKGKYKVYLTNRSNTGFKALEANIKRATKIVQRLKDHLVFRDNASASVRVDLLDKTTF